MSESLFYDVAEGNKKGGKEGYFEGLAEGGGKAVFQESCGEWPAESSPVAGPKTKAF